MKSYFDITDLKIQPLTRKNWDKFVQLFGERGACGGCWCMLFRSSNADFEKGKVNEGNKRTMKRLVWEGKPTGVLGLYHGKAIAWCALAPRRDFIKFERSRVHKPIDNAPVWSIPCFFVEKQFRRKGVSVAMLMGIINYAKKARIQILEAYPAIPTQDKLPDAFAWVGLYKSFKRAGFKIVDRTSRHRPMVRYYTNGS